MNSKLQNKWNYNLRSSDKHYEVYITFMTTIFALNA